jgi:hypothetical protein
MFTKHKPHNKGSVTVCEPNYELELYKLITENISEFGWCTESEFIVFPYLFELNDFIKSLSEIFGSDIFDDGGIPATIGDGYACIDIAAVVSDYGVDLVKVFPVEKYKH